MSTEPIYTYDEDGDILYVSFAPGETGTGIELNDHILLRVNKAEKQALGLTFFDFSVLIQMTEWGSRAFPLTGLAVLSAPLRQLVTEIITRPPVSQFLKLFAYTPSPTETVPVTAVEHPETARIPAAYAPQTRPRFHTLRESARNLETNNDETAKENY